MEELEFYKNWIYYTLDNPLKVLDKAILKIPNDKLQYSPAPPLRTASELIVHTYQQVFMYIYAVRMGEFKESDFGIFPIDSTQVTSSQQLVNYGQSIREYAKNLLPTISEQDLERDVPFFFGLKLKGAFCLGNILEEISHHRGQLYIYIRLMGQEPPFLYNFS